MSVLKWVCKQVGIRLEYFNKPLKSLLYRLAYLAQHFTGQHLYCVGAVDNSSTLVVCQLWGAGILRTT